MTDLPNRAIVPLSETRSLKGKVALVTGAADVRSIGWGIVLALAEAGADIAVNDIPARATALDERVKELQAMGQRAVSTPADVSRPDQAATMIAQAVEALGHVDIVASNAGIIRWEPFLEITHQNFRAIVDVNLKGTANVCRAAAQQMVTQGQGGRIIVTSSVQSDLNYPTTTVYGATKSAAHILVGTMALELAEHKITVNHIGPGWVRSALNDPAPGQQTDEDIQNQIKSVPLHRDGLPIEMGRAVAYLASEDAAYITGAFLRLDGGLALGKD